MTDAPPARLSRNLRCLRRAGGRPSGPDDGSSAVEFALVVPLLLALLLGIVEFGYVFNAQIQVTAAARDGARVVSISADPATTFEAARTATVQSAPTVTIDPATVDITVAPAGTAEHPCPSGSTATVRVEHPVQTLTGLFGATMTVTGEAVMQCGI